MSINFYLKELPVINKGLQHLIDLGNVYLKPLALEFGILNGHSDYCQFIILGRGRSGSNFLRGLLNSHSQIVVYGELFRFFDSIGWEFPAHDLYLQSPRLRSLIQTDPARFLQQKVFRKFPRHIAAVGFKLFYYHAQEDSRQPVWTFLKNKKALKVIHLKRNNTLKVLLSEKKAFKTNRWTNTTGEPEEEVRLVLEYEECLTFFERVQAEKAHFDAFFDGHDTIDIIYEELALDYNSEMKRIQEFLGVEFEIVQPLTYKQSHQTLSEAISNYSELKQKFMSSPWERFFED